MPQNKAGIATTIIMPELDGPAFEEISPNKTLFIQKLTDENPKDPEIKEGLTTVDEVFAHFKPSCTVELDKEDGSTIKENFAFGALADFDIKNLTNQSSFLKGLNLENDAYLKIIKQLKSNKTLKKAVDSPETKAAFINSLRALVLELEKSESEDTESDEDE